MFASFRNLATYFIALIIVCFFLFFVGNFVPSAVIIVKMLENPSTKSALELFTREITWDSRPTLSKFYSPAIFAVFGFAFASGINFFQRKPVLSGIIQ